MLYSIIIIINDDNNNIMYDAKCSKHYLNYFKLNYEINICSLSSSVHWQTSTIMKIKTYIHVICIKDLIITIEKAKKERKRIRTVKTHTQKCGLRKLYCFPEKNPP